MFKLKQWLKARKKRKSTEKYKDGFGWAMCAYYIEQKTIEEIENYSYGSSDTFDYGAGGAIFELRRIEEAKNDLRETLERLSKCEFVLSGEIDMAETREQKYDS